MDWKKLWQQTKETSVSLADRADKCLKRVEVGSEDGKFSVGYRRKATVDEEYYREVEKKKTQKKVEKGYQEVEKAAKKLKKYREAAEKAEASLAVKQSTKKEV